jgi:hypothetical protein
MTGHHGDPTAESIEGPFLRVARRYSLCDDDAWEALARGFEIAMRHRERIRPDTASAWFCDGQVQLRRAKRRRGPTDDDLRYPRATPAPSRQWPRGTPTPHGSRHAAAPSGLERRGVPQLSRHPRTACDQVAFV